jgi:hypothetical protein
LSNDENDNWDDAFEGDLMTVKGPRRSHDADATELETIRPISSKSQSHEPKPLLRPKSEGRKRSHEPPLRPRSPMKLHSQAQFPIPARLAAQYREQGVEDYSDLFLENDNVFDRRLDLVKDDALSPKLFHPSDLTSLPRSAQPPSNPGSLSRRQHPPRPDVREQSMRRARSDVEIQRYAEDEGDEDFSDIFGKNENIAEKAESDLDSENGALMLHSKLSNNSWLGDEDDEDDPFASLEQGFDEMDLQANIARDKHARLCTLVEGLVSSLKTTQAEDILSELSEQLVCLQLTFSNGWLT